MVQEERQVPWELLVLQDPRARQAKQAQPVLREHKAQPALRARLVRQEPSHRQLLLPMQLAQKTL